MERLETYIYFSAVTLFSVGYGDIAPIGIGRVIAMIEALIGYTIPAAFVAKAFIDIESEIILSNISCIWLGIKF